MAVTKAVHPARRRASEGVTRTSKDGSIHRTFVDGGTYTHDAQTGMHGYMLPPAPPAKPKQIQVYVPAAVHEKLRRIAARRGCALTDVVREALRRLPEPRVK